MPRRVVKNFRYLAREDERSLWGRIQMKMRGFGYGDFSLKNDTLSESEQLTSHWALMGRTFAIKITFKGSDEYSQVITDSKSGEQSVEIYRRLK